MSNSNKPSCSRSSSTQSKLNARVVALTSMDAKLNADFEESENPFDFSSTINATNHSAVAESSATPSKVSAYLRRMHREILIQPFGCTIAVEQISFAVIAFSENAPEMLDLAPCAVPSIEQREAFTIGTDARALFNPPSAIALEKAAGFDEISLLNPILVHCRNSGKPFYAIMHRIDKGLVIDLEPVNPADVPLTAAGALKSYKLAAKAISRLQSLPSGSVPLLCDVLVREVRDLTGYDRVMAYKFHDDEHGEVIAECQRSNLESYLGLHYPATDIPQASRFLFMKNKIRMIFDCSAQSVKVIQDKRLTQPLSLCGSTLRAPHGCHAQYMANMGTVASLVMSVTVNEDDNDYNGSGPQHEGRKLWGLVVCHHMSPRFVPFPLRYACEILLQVFGIQLNKEVKLAAQTREKHIIQTQAVLCDMLLRDAPFGIFTQSPNVMDLVECDGAALYYRNQCSLLGIAPTEVQISYLAAWLLKYHDQTTGLSTDSLLEAGYPGASDLGDAVCGMAAVKITHTDFIFWFRSHAAKDIKWGGAKHDPVDWDGEEKKLHPRSSFKAFLDVAKQRSLPWEDVEMDAIHSLQLILRGSLANPILNDENPKSLINLPVDDVKKIQGFDEMQMVANEMVRLIETANAPILAVDALGNVNGWNTKAADLTGLPMEQAIGRPLINLVEHDSIDVTRNMLYKALQGKEEQNVEFKLKRFSSQENNDPVMLVVNACCSRDIKDNVVGVCFVAQDVTAQKLIMDKYARIKGDYTTIVRNPSGMIPPIFIIDEHGSCIEWNVAMQKLTGLRREDAINKILIGEVFSHQKFGCQVKDLDLLVKLRIALNNVLAGQNIEKLLFGFFDRNDKYVEALLTANKRTNMEGKTTGAFCFLHVATPELTHALKVQKLSEKAATDSLKELAYIRQQIGNPLHGIIFIQNLMEASDLTAEQKQILRTRIICQQQLTKIIDHVDLESIEDGYMEMDTTKFYLKEVLEAVIAQGMIQSKERDILLVNDSPEEISSISLYGDSLRLQQVLSDFLLNAIQFTSLCQGSIVFRTTVREQHLGKMVKIAHLEFRIAHPAPGIPDALVQEMFHHRQGITREGLGLHISQKLVKLMNGTVQYVKEADSSSFIINMEFPLVGQKRE